MAHQKTCTRPQSLTERKKKTQEKLLKKENSERSKTAGCGMAWVSCGESEFVQFLDGPVAAKLPRGSENQRGEKEKTIKTGVGRGQSSCRSTIALQQARTRWKFFEKPDPGGWEGGSASANACVTHGRKKA